MYLSRAMHLERATMSFQQFASKRLLADHQRSIMAGRTTDEG